MNSQQSVVVGWIRCVMEIKPNSFVDVVVSCFLGRPVRLLPHTVTWMMVVERPLDLVIHGRSNPRSSFRFFLTIEQVPCQCVPIA